LRSEINDREAMIKKLEESIKKFQNNSAHKEEEDAYRISLLEQKINNYENDIKEDLNQIEILKTEIKAL
jgi:predicted RNase H-like nuclease (RuvC/YqgF family)